MNKNLPIIGKVVFYLLLVLAVFLIYYSLFEITLGWIIGCLVAVVLYALAMAGSHVAQNRLLRLRVAYWSRQERLLSDKEFSSKRVARLVWLIAAPLYVACLWIAFIPIMVWEAALMIWTAVLIVCYITLKSVLETWRAFGYSRAAFWLMHIGMYLCTVVCGQGLVQLLISI